MTDTTKIGDLPENVTMSVHASPSLQLPPVDGSSSGQLDTAIINKLVSDIQMASANGATRLRSKDIPVDPIGLSADPNVQQHYIPPPVSHQGHGQAPPYPQHQQPLQNGYGDYIEEDDNMDDIITRIKRKTSYNNQIDYYLDELQMPLIVAIMFFLFQLPFVRKLLYENFAFLYYSDGNMNMNGYVIISFIFGFIYYVLCKILN